MFGSFLGDVAGTLYFMIFQVVGVLIAFTIFKRENRWFKLLFGSVMGSFLLHWLPTLAAFFMDFTVQAHISALFLLALILVAVLYLDKRFIGISQKFSDNDNNLKSINVSVNKDTNDGKKSIVSTIVRTIKDKPVLLVLAVLYGYIVKVWSHHVLTFKDGAVLTGQCTYGDMNMHLGFITSIAVQKIFPPDYSILPGTKLAYPFLSDSISSSVYLFGASLKWSYILPMLFALLQVMFGAYALMDYILADKKKIFLSYILFFLNGGLGFLYFINKGFTSQNFKRIFTEFYQTPTNYTTKNIMWHNIIADMLIPQRATLFGWAMLFPLLYLITKAIKEEKRQYFYVAGVIAGGLPLIHTHSFLALGILCAGFVLLELIDDEKKQFPVWLRAVILAGVLVILEYVSRRKIKQNPVSANALLAMGVFVIAVLVVAIVYLVVNKIKVNGKTDDRLKKLFKCWGSFLVIVLVLALPILFKFTFSQATGEQFTRGSFNWANDTEGYFLFSVKNFGVMFVGLLFVYVFGNRKQMRLVIPPTFLWLMSEFIVFQPNTYDNNKLMLVSYLYFCIAVSDFAFDMLAKINIKVITVVTAAAVGFVGIFGAVLTLGREYVSEYELYSKGYLEAAEYIEKNTLPSDMILTATNHNNAIASLTGRSIVCGAGTFLYFHGVDYGQNEADVKTMYEVPEHREELLNKYNVKYIVIGANELGYNIPDYDNLVASYEVVFNQDNVVILKRQG